MAVLAGALADLSFGLRHAADRYEEFSHAEHPAQNADLFHELARERANDADELDAMTLSAGLTEIKPTLDAYAANQVLGLGNSHPWSASGTAYRVLRAENALGRMAGHLASLSDELSIGRTLGRLRHHIDSRRPAVQNARRRAQRNEASHFVAANTTPKKLSDGQELVVWYATNRSYSRPGSFLPERSNHVSFGRCHVFVPNNRVMGTLGSGLVSRLIKGDDRIRLGAVQPINEGGFWSLLSREIASGGDADRQAILFLHGFRTSFEDAARRTAQLKADLGHPGPAAFFSWPSLGSAASYAGDEAAIEGSELPIRNFLTDFARRSGASAIHIIAHSMGNRGLTRAFEAISLMAATASDIRFGQVFLAAPDVDADYFKHVAAAYGRLSARSTLYVTNNDKAIGLSRRLHGYPRVGLTPPVALVSGIDTVDASHVNLSLIGHGYAAEMRPVLGDINRLLQSNTPPDQRFGLRRAGKGIVGHWEFKP